MAEVPQAAIDAAARAIQREHDPESWDAGDEPTRYDVEEARAAVEGAASHIPAAERERIAALVEHAGGEATVSTCPIRDCVTHRASLLDLIRAPEGDTGHA